MTIHVSGEREVYTGEQLRSLWLREHFGVPGDAAVAFLGGCQVETELMVDVADREKKQSIVAKEMLHFILEHFGLPLSAAAVWQRLLVAELAELLRERAPEKSIRRQGNDLFLGERKLTVSVATASPVSALIHLGVNVDPAGAPVAAVGLNEIGVEPLPLAEQLLQTYAQEWEGVKTACAKVRWVP